MTGVYLYLVPVYHLCSSKGETIDDAIPDFAPHFATSFAHFAWLKQAS